MDQSLRLQLSRRRVDAAARNTQYLRHRLVRDIESAVACPVTRQEQPAGQPLIYRVEKVADGRLRNLFVQSMGVTEQG